MSAVDLAPARSSTHDRSGSSAVARRLMAAFVLTTVLAPAAFINKVIFLVILAWILIDGLAAPRRMVLPTISPLIAIAIFAYGLGLSVVGTNDQDIARQYFSSTLVLLLFYFVHRHRIALDDVVVDASILLVVGMILFWLSVIMPDLPGRDFVYTFFDKYNFSAATDREFFDGEAVFTLQLGTTPFLLVGLAVVLFRLGKPGQRRLDWLWLIIFSAAIVVSGLRGLLVVSLALLMGFALVRTKLVGRFLLMGIFVMGAAIVYLALMETQVFSSDEVSNAVKIGHYRSFVRQLDLPNFLFGKGLGSYYYSTGSGALRSYTELTPFDIARYVGVPLTLVLYAALVLPFARLSFYTGERCLYVLVAGLFIVLSLTNPVMVNSYGMLIVVWYWSKLATPASMS